MSAVVFEDVGKRFGDVWAVRGLSLSIEAGETFVLVGGSGCGKTTTLRMINRLEEATEGTIEVLGQRVDAVPGPALRRRIGYVIQEAGLFAHLDVRDNVAVVPRLLGWEASRIQTRVGELLERVGLPDGEFGARYPAELSGGQRQRVGLARALAADPPLVLLDEPFGALDPVTRAKVQDEFMALARDGDKTYVLVTHDMHEAVRLGDRIAVMDAGAAVRVADTAALVADPGHPVVEELLAPQRMQLRLMTIPLSAVAADGVRPSDGARVVELSPHDSVWDALSACERTQAAGVVVGARFIPRKSLGAVVLGSMGPGRPRKP